MTKTAGHRQEALLVLRAQSGDRDALDQLLKSVQQPLFAYVRRLAGGRSLAEDVLQEVFLLIYRKLRWLEDPALFRAWAYRIASRETFKALRRERRWAAQAGDDETLASLPAPACEVGGEPELIGQLPRLVARLSPASRAVLVLHYMHDMPLSEVAEVLGLPHGTAKSRLAYGLAALRRSLRDEAGGGKDKDSLGGDDEDDER